MPQPQLLIPTDTYSNASKPSLMEPPASQHPRTSSASGTFDEELCHYIAEECSLDYLFYMKGTDESKYHVLNERANILADWLLHDHDVSVGTKVLLDINNESLRLVTLIAVLKCGGVACAGTPSDVCTLRLTDEPVTEATLMTSRTNSFDSASVDSTGTQSDSDLSTSQDHSSDQDSVYHPQMMDDKWTASTGTDGNAPPAVSVHNCPLSGRTHGNISHSGPDHHAIVIPQYKHPITHKDLVFQVLRGSNKKNIDLFETLHHVYDQLTSGHKMDG